MTPHHTQYMHHITEPLTFNTITGEETSFSSKHCSGQQAGNEGDRAMSRPPYGGLAGLNSNRVTPLLSLTATVQKKPQKTPQLQLYTDWVRCHPATYSATSWLASTIVCHRYSSVHQRKMIWQSRQCSIHRENNVCICVCVFVCVCIRICMHVFVYIYVYVCMHVCKYKYIHTHTYIHTYKQSDCEEINKKSSSEIHVIRVTAIACRGHIRGWEHTSPARDVTTAAIRPTSRTSSWRRCPSYSS